MPMLPVSLFGDAGGLTTTHPLADAGVGCVFGPVRVTLPLWVGDPEPGRKPWRFRWLVSLESLPISF